MDSVRPDLCPLLRVTAAVLVLGAQVAAGDLAARADAGALAELLEECGYHPADAKRGTA